MNSPAAVKPLTSAWASWPAPMKPTLILPVHVQRKKTLPLQGFIHFNPTQTDDIHSIKLVASLQVCAVVVNKPTSLLGEANDISEPVAAAPSITVNIFTEKILTNIL